ncbi:hypothetical protein RSAG8_13129, partial [Rhizoctonia solani AG-8 WAC10335]
MDRIRAFDGSNYQHLKGALVTFSSWLVDSMTKSIAILKLTFREHAQAWREAVVSAYLTYPDENIGNESISLDTHGIPRSKDTLTDCYDELQASDTDITFSPDDCEITQLANHLRQWVLNAVDDREMSDRNSTSGEEIEIPDFGSDTKDEQSDSPAPELSDVESDYDLGIHQSRFHSASIISARAPGGKAANKESLQHSLLLGPSEEHGFGTDVEVLREPSWIEESMVDDRTVDSNNSAVPQSVLADLSFLPQASTESNSIRRSKLTMEVVIPTPMKKSKPLKPSTKDQQGAEISPTGDSDEDPMTSKAVRRPRRSVARSGLVEAAIRAAAKGKYVPKGKEA